MLKKTSSIILAFVLSFILFTDTAQAITGVWHSPYGLNCIYDIELTERSPRDPSAGENVYIKCTTWPIETGQSVWVSYTKNGVAQPDVGASWDYNSGNNSYWVANIGSFAKGDQITYTVYANKDGANTKNTGAFSFAVTDWEYVASAALYSSTNGKVIFNATPNTGSFSPKFAISFPSADTYRMQLSPNGSYAFNSGLSNYTVSETTSAVSIETSKIRVVITKNPYKLQVYDVADSTLISESGGSSNRLAWLTDGSTVINKVKDGYASPSDEQFYGFGEHYTNFQKRGSVVETYIYNQYQNQGSKTYLSVPFFYSSKGYGLYLNSTYYSKFDMASSDSTQYTFAANTDSGLSSILDYYFIGGDTPDDVISQYSNITSLPQDMPKYAFGLWMSANEWDRQSEVVTAVDNSATYDIPATVVVLEQWSDENTFYIWNDATYTPVAGSAALSNSDFTYGTKWPNPTTLANYIHSKNMKLILWQVPVLKYTSYSYTQKDNDEAYMIQQGYAVGDGSGSQYRIPASGWFGNSLLLDFTNPSAVTWWMSKRAYLFDDIGIDGFKTDGGEMVWGKSTSFYDGSTESKMRNLYPNLYINAYNDYAQSKNGSDGITFSRSGTAGTQQAGAYWAGDQTSSFSAFADAVRAGLSAGISGVPFWGWDLAGFTGDFPSAELYKRSMEMAAFSPIMQFHSETADPAVSAERSPWNVQTRTGDTTVVSTFSKFINTRMNLLPYIYSESQISATEGTPMMRAMLLDFPEDTNTYSLYDQYMFGHDLLVAPILNQGQTTKSVYLPEGDWIDLFNNAMTAGGQTKSYYADVNTLPVYVKNGSIIPMNLNSNYVLGGTIGNDIENYTNLVFRVYPLGDSTYTLTNEDKTTMTVSSSENFASNQVTVTIPAATIPVTTQLFASEPTGVTVNGSALTKYTDKASFISATSGYYYNSVEKLAYIKVPSGTSSRSIVVSGVNKAPYEAEHATLTNVSTNTNHANFYGDCFVDQFATQGDSVTFDVNVTTAGTHQIIIRYCAGTENAARTVTINSGSGQSVSLAKTTDWDTWGTYTLSATLTKGKNTVTVAYNSGDSAGINLDCIMVK